MYKGLVGFAIKLVITTYPQMSNCEITTPYAAFEVCCYPCVESLLLKTKAIPLVIQVCTEFTIQMVKLGGTAFITLYFSFL